MYKQIENKLDYKTKCMFVEAVEIEREFICESLPCSLGMSLQDLMTHILNL